MNQQSTMIPPSAHARRVLHSSESADWYTPAESVNAARTLMGGIDLDPASCALANETVQAARYYTAEENGLRQPWYGRVWLNPPYGRTTDGRSNQGLWSTRLIAEYETGAVTEAVLLVNAATDTTWFRPLWRYWICLVYDRIEFDSPAGERNSPTHGSAFVYLGHQGERFRTIFEPFGRVVAPDGQSGRATRYLI
ncbi:MAG: DNA N-6-adenine-methyltransferase [Dehalococcoidia bacterium]